MVGEIVTTKKRLRELMKGRKVRLNVLENGMLVGITRQEACQILNCNFSCVEVEDEDENDHTSALILTITHDVAAIEKVVQDLLARHSFEKLVAWARDNWRNGNTLEEKTTNFLTNFLEVEDLATARKQLDSVGREPTIGDVLRTRSLEEHQALLDKYGIGSGKKL